MIINIGVRNVQIEYQARVSGLDVSSMFRHYSPTEKAIL